MLARKLCVRGQGATDLKPAALRSLYVSAGREAEYEATWAAKDKAWRLHAVQALDRACRHEFAANFLKPAKETWADLRKAKKLELFYGQIGGSDNAIDLSLMRGRLGGGYYASSDAFLAELALLETSWASYQAAGGEAGEEIASSARAVRKQVQLELLAVAKGQPPEPPKRQQQQGSKGQPPPPPPPSASASALRPASPILSVSAR